MPDPGDEKKWLIEMTAAATPGADDATMPDSEVRRISVEGDAAAQVSLGPYAIRKELGRGGQGVVYQAVDTRLGRQVALKVLSGIFGGDAWSRLRFEREATATARIDHPGICTVYEAGTIDQTPFIAMRLVAGEPLAARIAHAKARPTTKLPSSVSGSRHRRDALFADVGIVEKAARALHVAHEAGLVHRDIKPGNVMVEPSGQPVVLDFGLARDARNQDLLLTGTGTFLGTPPYMSPEQVDATGAVDRRTDVWSLGVVLYEVATGARPFEAPTIEGLLRAIRTAEPADPRKLNPAVTPELSAVILRALEKDRGRRYQDALALADDIGRACRLEAVHARAPSTTMRLWRWAQRNPALAASLAIVIAGLSVALVVSLLALGAARDALSRETAAKTEARDQRNRAEDLLAFMLFEMKQRLEEVGRLDLLARVARKASDYFAARPLDLDQETESLQRALALRNVGDVIKAEGDVVAAIARYEEACRIEEEILRRNPANAAALRDLVTTVHAQAVAAMVRGDRTGCLAQAERSLDLRRQLVALAPDDCDAKALLVSGMVMRANALKFSDRAAEAIPVYEDAIGKWESVCGADSRPARRRELAIALQNLGDARKITGDPLGAIAARRRGLSVFESLAHDEPQNRDWQEQIAASRHGIALVLNERGDYATAAVEERQAVAVFRRLLAEDPGNTRRLYQLGTALYALGNHDTDGGHPIEGLAALEEAATVRERLAARDPKNLTWRADLGDSVRAIAQPLALRGLLPEALARAEAATAAFRELSLERADDAFVRGRLANALIQWAELLRESGRPADAAQRLVEAAEIGSAAAGPKPSVRAMRQIAGRLEDAASACEAAADRSRARDLLRRAIAVRRELLSGAPQESERDAAKPRLGSNLVLLGELGIEDADPDAAFASLEEGIALLASAHQQAPADHEIAQALLRALLATALARSASGDTGAADAAIERAQSLFDDLPPDACSTGDEGRIRMRLEIARRMLAPAGEGPKDALDHEAAARRMVAAGRPADALDAFDAAIRASRGGSPAQRMITIEAAIDAAVRAHAAAAADQRARIEACALRWISDATGVLSGRARTLEERAAAQAAQGPIAQPVRDELAEIRCHLACIRELNPLLAPFRKLPGFPAMR